MSDFERFLKKNKAVRSHGFFAASKAFTDEDGEPVKWEIRPLTTTEFFELRDECTDTRRTDDGRNVEIFDRERFLDELICAAVVFPNLHSAELLESYGAEDAADVVKMMLDDPQEYTAFVAYITSFSGLESMPEMVKTAKN